MKKPAKSKTPSPLPFDQQVALRLQELSPSKDVIQHSEDAITPSVDVIHSSGDVIGVSEDARKGNSGNGSDCRELKDVTGGNRDDLTKMVVAQGQKKDVGWHENSLIPTQPHLLGDAEQEERYLAVLADKRYHILAAPAYGCSVRTVERRMLANPEFAAAVSEVRSSREQLLLAAIEGVSEEQALIPSKVTDRAIQLNALAPSKYKRDSKGVQVATQVNIMIGFTPPKHRGT